MANRTLYDLLDLPVGAPPHEIDRAIRREMSGASEAERETLLHVARTLLDPASRAAYHRLNGLAPPLQDAPGATMDEALRDLDRERRAKAGRATAELRFALEVSFIVSIATLLLLAGRALLPAIEPQIAWLAALRGIEEQATPLTVALLSLPALMIAILLIGAFERVAGDVIRFLLTIGALGLLIVVALQFLLSDRGGADRTLAAGAAGIAMLFLGAALVRLLGVRALGRINQAPRGPRSR